MNRRSFFGVTLGAIAAAVMSWRKPKQELDWKSLPSSYVLYGDGSVVELTYDVSYIGAGVVDDVGVLCR